MENDQDPRKGMTRPHGALRKKLSVCEEGVGRLDRFLKKNYRSVPYGGLISAVRKGRVRVNGKKTPWNHMLALGDEVETSFVDCPKVSRPSSQYSTRDVKKICLFEDKFFFVCNKPRGVPVHLGTGHGPGLDALLSWYSQHNNIPAIRLGHRLDKETTGVLVCPKSREAANVFRQKIESREVQKDYIAVLNGWVCQSQGTIEQDLYIEGKKVQAVTRYQTLAKTKKYTLVGLQAVTGRKRQLRSHCAALNHPIVGDKTCLLQGKSPLMLHAYSVSLKAFDKTYRWTSPLPQDLQSFISKYIRDDLCFETLTLVW